MLPPDKAVMSLLAGARGQIASCYRACALGHHERSKYRKLTCIKFPGGVISRQRSRPSIWGLCGVSRGTVRRPASCVASDRMSDRFLPARPPLDWSSWWCRGRLRHLAADTTVAALLVSAHAVILMCQVHSPSQSPSLPLPLPACSSGFCCGEACGLTRTVIRPQPNLQPITE